MRDDRLDGVCLKDGCGEILLVVKGQGGTSVIEVASSVDETAKHLKVIGDEDKTVVAVMNSDALIEARNPDELTTTIKGYVDGHGDIEEIWIDLDDDASYGTLVRTLDAVIEGSKGQKLIVL